MAQAAITDFLATRLKDKLDALSPTDPKRAELIAQFQPATWLEDAARRVRQVQAVTHALKPIHPDARGTNLYVLPSGMPPLDVVGSHVLGESFTSDVVGNAAALDVYKLLKLDVGGSTLLERLVQNDPDAVNALSDDAQTAAALRDAFVSITESRDAVVASHARAKQVYWLVGQHAPSNADYHLLAPLFPTSLAHVVHAEIHEDRFGDANREARAARRARVEHDGVARVYPDLAVRKLGGTKPQNVSQLNSERGGLNYLLGSLPPLWEDRRQPQPWHIASVIQSLLPRRPLVRATLRGMLRFLLTNPPQNIETRDRIDEFFATLIDELVALAGELRRGLPDGWTTDRRCELPMDEQLWLDPGRVKTDEAFRAQWMWMDWPAQIGHRFGNWLNGRLDGHLPVGEAEQRHWRKELLVDESAGGWAQDLDAMRTQNDSPRFIPARQGNV